MDVGLDFVHKNGGADSEADYPYRGILDLGLILTIPTHSSALCYPTHAVSPALLGAPADRVLTAACNPML